MPLPVFMHNIVKSPDKITHISVILGITVLSIISGYLALTYPLHHDVAAFLLLAKRFPFNIAAVYEHTVILQVPMLHYFTSIATLPYTLTAPSLQAPYVIWVIIVAYIALVLSYKITISNSFYSTQYRVWLIVSVSAVIFILPFILPNSNFSNFGTREHLFCICILPYMWLLGNYMQNASVNSKILQIAVGVLALIAVTLKPHFIIFVICIELYNCINQKSLSPLKRLPTLTLIITLLLYHILWLGLYPVFLETLPYYVTIYSAYNPTTLTINTLHTGIMVIVVCLALYFIKKYPYNTHIALLLVALFGTVLITVLQTTFMGYQALPQYTMLYILAFTLLFTCVTKPKIVLLVIATTVMMHVASKDYHFPRYSRYTERLETHIAQKLCSKSSFVLSTSIYPFFNIMLNSNTQWQQPNWFMMHVPYAYAHYNTTHKYAPYHKPDAMDKTEAFFFNHIIHHLNNNTPTFLLVDTNPVKQGLKGLQFDFIAYFTQNAAFNEKWQYYRKIYSAEHIDVYEYTR